MKNLMKLTMVATMYVVLTVALSPISYGNVQFRFAEILMILVLYKRDYLISLVIGCAISNIFSPFGIIDCLVGTSATLIAGLLMIAVKSIYIAWIFPVLFNGVFVGLEIVIIEDMPNFISSFLMMGGFVALGEAVVLIIGVVLFKILEKNEVFMNLIKE